MKKIMSVVLILTAAFSVIAMDDYGDVGYPAGFRSWQHVKTGIIQPGHALEASFGGIHHVYANTKAMHGLTVGQYESGAVFVFDLLDYQNSDNTIVEGARKRIDVMHYDSGEFADTGGWGFASYLGNSETALVEQDVVVACYACHEAVKAKNFVFSQYRK